MEIVIDIVLVVIILLSIYLGYKKGLANVGFNLLAVIVALAVTIIAYRPLTDVIINKTELDENIEKIIIEHGISETGNNTENNEVSDYIENYVQKLAKDAQNAAVQTSARGIAISIVGIGVMLVLFIGTRIVLMLLKIVLNAIAKLPVLKQCNELGGIIYGLLRGLIFIYALLAIAFFVVPLTGDYAINTAIEKSYVTKFFYNNNIILNFIL